MSTQPDPAVVWHDVECGSYRADLALWQELADEHGDPILDVGAGTGRVTLELARRGRTVTALDTDARLLKELSRRARRLPITPEVADARQFELDRRFALIIVPMQSIQLLGGAKGRDAFLSRARSHLQPGGLLAVAVTEQFDLYRPEPGHPPLSADVLHVKGTTYSSRPVAVRPQGDAIVLERRREMISGEPQQRLAAEDDAVRVDRLSAAQLEAEAGRRGLKPAGHAEVPATPYHVGSVVVMLRG